MISPICLSHYKNRALNRWFCQAFVKKMSKKKISMKQNEAQNKSK